MDFESEGRLGGRAHTVDVSDGSEAQALKKRGDAYRQYQAKTSAFVPWFPKERA